MIGHDEARVRLGTQLRTAKTITLALAGGVVMFSAVVMMLRLSGSPPATPQGVPAELLGVIAVAAVITTGVASRLVRAKMLEPAERRLAEDGELTVENAQLLGSKITQASVIGGAMVETGGLLAGVALLLNGPVWILGVCLGAAIVIAMQLPTRGQAEAIVERATGRPVV